MPQRKVLFKTKGTVNQGLKAAGPLIQQGLRLTLAPTLGTELDVHAPVAAIGEQAQVIQAAVKNELRECHGLVQTAGEAHVKAQTVENSTGQYGVYSPG